MTNAIAYIRISDKDQSNFSLDGQQKFITDHCHKQNMLLLESFIDDGRSAKNFDRPNWKALEVFIQQHHRKVNYLVVVKYDRFSRNAAEGLQKIEWLEKKYNIIIVSVFEQMFIDCESPFFFKQRADMLVTAEFEWHVIRDRTKFGMHQALSTGRYVSKAPVGYINSRDEKNKPILTIDDTRAPLIRNLFQQYMDGHSLGTISKYARQNGLQLTGRSALPRILCNPVYAGMVNVFSYRKEPSKIIDALHPAIVDKQLWWQVQKKLSQKSNPKIQVAEDVPLRQQVAHTCGAKLTAGKSKGKNNYYWYYKCNTCPRTNYSAIIMHKKFNELMHSLSFSQQHINYLLAETEKQMQQQLTERTGQLTQIKKQWQDAVTRLESLEEKFILNHIQKETYEKYYYRYSAEAAALQHQVTQLSSNQNEYWEAFNTGLYRLQNIQWLWQKATLMQKHEFIRLVFNSSLMYDGTTYRTPYLLSLFHHNILELKQKNLLTLVETGLNNVKSVECAPHTTNIEHLRKFILLINTIKAA